MKSGKYYICVTPFFPSAGNWRGAYILDQVKAIQRNSDYRVIVFLCCGLRELPASYTTDGITVKFTPALFMPSYFLNGFTNGLNGKLFLRTLEREGIALEDIAVVHSHTVAYACFATAVKKKNDKVISMIQYHDRDPYQIRNGKLAGWKPNLTYRAKTFIKQFPCLDYHVCISEVVRDNLLNFPGASMYETYKPYLDRLSVAKGIKTSSDIKTIILYNGVDTTKFYPLKHKNNNIFKIGCIANFVPLKSHLTLIKAVGILVKKYPNIKVSFIGSGPTQAECEQYISSHNLEEHFEILPEVQHEDLLEYYNSLDLFVLPTEYEGFGCVMTEAAACGVPFITCEHQGAAEYILDSEADKWLIHPGDYQQLSENISNYIENRCGQHYRYSFDIDVLIKQFIDNIAPNDRTL